MQTNPLISIITVCFNAEKTIEATIASVINQNHSHFEYIIIDGKSVDATMDIVNHYSEHINVIISEPDNGIYDAMNKGIKQASGEWILFLGADDTLCSEDTLNECSSRFLSGYDFIYGDVIKTPSQIRYDGEFNLFKLIYKNICHQGIFFNTSIFQKLGLYNQKYRINADWEFNMRAYQDSSIKIKYIPVVISYFFEDGVSGHHVDEAYEKRRKEFLKTMPIWVKLCFKFRKTFWIKWISKTFLNFDYA